MLIRGYQSKDCPALAQLFYDTVHTVNAKDYSEEQLGVWAAERIDLEAWDRSFSAHDTLIAEIDGTIVGFADMDHTGYLDKVYVHRDFQGIGIASALVSQLEQRAGRAGVVRFETFSSITARPFFEKQGYGVKRENRLVRTGIALTNYQMVKQV